MKRTIISTMFLIVATGCAHDELSKIDNELERKGTVNGKALGIDSERRLVLQEEFDLDQEYRAQLLANTRLQEGLAEDRLQLQKCQDQLGLVDIIEIIQDETPAFTGNEQIGLNEAGEMKVVRKEKFLDIFKIERKRTENLIQTTKIIANQRRECEVKRHHS